MDYGRLFTRAWDIVWNNKFLWVLGFLVALGSGGGSASTNFRGGGDGATVPGELQRFLDQYLILLVGLACVVFILAIILWLLRLAAEAGLVYAVDRLDNGARVSLGEALSAGSGYILRLIGISLVLYLPLLLIAAVGTALALLLGGASLAASIGSEDPGAILASLGILLPCLCLFICFVVIYSVIASAIYILAVRGAVLNNLGVLDSVRDGWQVLRAHLAEFVLVWLALFVIGLLFGFLAAAVLLPLAFLAFGPALLAALSGGDIGPLEIAAIVGGGLCVGVLGAIIRSVLTAYASTSYTLAYKEFTGKSKAAVPAMA